MTDAAGVVAEAILSEHLIILGELAAMKLGYVLGAGHQASVCVCVCTHACAPLTCLPVRETGQWG